MNSTSEGAKRVSGRAKRVGFWLAVLCVLLGAAAFFAIRANGHSTPPYNVLIVSIDTLRPDHLGCYGYERDTSSAIDALAEEGALFTKTFAQRGETWPSLASIMTSTYPITHGVRSNGIMLRDEQPSLATVLKEHGYGCGALLANATQQNWQGFDGVAWGTAEQLTEGSGMGMYAAVENKERFFFWLHYWDPHAPYTPAEGYRDLFDPGYSGEANGEESYLNAVTKGEVNLSDSDLNHVVSLYDEEIAFVDDKVEQVLGYLDTLGLADETIVVFTADHGEDLHEHNRYFGHSASVYDSSLHIPLIFRVPGKRFQRRIDTIVESIDIAPTILDLLGIEAPDSFQGTSLVPLLEGKELELGPAFAEWQDQIVTVRTETHKYVLNPLEYHPFWLIGDPEERYPIGKEELFDVRKDPDELNNMVAAGTSTAEVEAVRSELEGLVKGWIERYGWKLNEYHGVEKKIDPEIRQQLEALGYVL